MTTTTYLVTCYLSLAFIKFMLCLPMAPTVIAVMSRLHGAEKGQVTMRYVFSIPIFLILSSVFLWVYSMYSEGFGFFSIYTKRAVMKDCVRAYRTAHPTRAA